MFVVSFIITKNKFHIRERRNICSCLGNWGKLWPEGIKDFTRKVYAYLRWNKVFKLLIC